VAPTDNPNLDRLIDQVIDRHLDALTFTSTPGVEATLGAARATGRLESLVAALQGDVVTTATGPVTAGLLVESGVEPILPDRYRLGALIRLVTEHLDTHRVRRLVRAGVEIELRGRRVVLDGNDVTLGPSSLALVADLPDEPDEPDDHALEVALSRLRRALGVPGPITTVVKRGYRLGP